MAKIKLCKITGGKVRNIAVVDDKKRLDFMEDWIAYREGAVVGGTWDGAVFGPPPERTDADIDAEAEKKVRKQVGDAAPPELKAMFEIIADLVVAGGLANNKAQARALVAQRLKQYYADEVKGKRQAGRGT